MCDEEIEKVSCQSEEQGGFSDTFVDEDMFDLESPSDIGSPVQQENPIEDHLIKQLSVAEDQLKKTENRISDLRQTVKRILKSLQRDITGEYETSDSDTDLHTITGEPTIKRKRNDAPSNISYLELISRWQRVIGDKWIIGVTLKNTSNVELSDLGFILHANDTESMQIKSVFWHRSQLCWQMVGTIEAEAKVVAVASTDLPVFKHSNLVQFGGIILYTANERKLQLVLPQDRLHAMDTIDTLALNFMGDKNESILALRSSSVQRTLTFKDSDAMRHVVAVMQRLRFTEITPYVHVVTKTGSLHLCSIEIFPTNESDTVNVRLSASTRRQLRLFLQLIRDEFPEAVAQAEVRRRRAAIKALLAELDALLADKSPAELQRLAFHTDLLIP